MIYEIGDIVIHWTHGFGKVIAIDEMLLAGLTQSYYVVDVGQFKIWVPVEAANQGPLRFPAESIEFKQLINSLQTPGEKLPDNQYKRKIVLRERIQKRTLEGLFHLIRDLTDLSRKQNLNQNDTAVLFRAEEYLLDEWVLSLGTERESAQIELDGLLRGEQSEVDG